MKTLVALLAVALWIFASNPAFAQKRIKDFPITDGEVYDLLVKGDTLFVGGTFSHFYFRDSVVRFATLVDSIQGYVVPGLPKFNGRVDFVFPDSSKGYFFTGTFTKVGDSLRNGLVHLDSNFRVTEKVARFGWNGIYTAPEPIHYRNNTLYFKGRFTGIGEGVRKTSGTVFSISKANTAGNIPDINGAIHCVVADGRGGWYVGGEFTQVGDSVRINLAHIDSNGYIYPWKPAPDAPVQTMYLANDKLFISGQFRHIDTAYRAGFCALDTATGIPNNWNIGFNPFSTDQVNAMAMDNGILYIGGTFYSIGLYSRYNIAAIDMSTGLVTSWQPISNGNVTALLPSGNKVFAAGNFTSMGFTTRTGIVAISKTTAICSPWNAGVNGPVYGMALEGSTIYFGGSFTQVKGGTYLRKNIAAMDTSGTGTVITAFTGPSSFNASSAIRDVHIKDNSLFITGSFSEIDSSQRNGVAAVSKATGTLQSMKLALGFYYYGNYPTPENYKLVLSPYNSDQFFLGATGKIPYMGGTARSHLGAIDVNTSTITAWDPDLDGNPIGAAVYENNLYVGGTFTHLRKTKQKYYAVVDLNTGVAAPAAFSFDNWIFDIKVSGSTLYIGGDFDFILTHSNSSSVARTGLASINLLNNTLTSFSKNIEGYNGAVWLSSVSWILPVGESIYISGNFAEIDNQGRRNNARISTTGTYDVLPWKAQIKCNNNITKSMAYHNGKIMMVSQACMYAVDSSIGNIVQWDPAPDYLEMANMFAFNDRIFVTGDYNIAGVKPILKLAAYNMHTQKILDITPDVDLQYNIYVKSVTTLDHYNNKLYIGGSFNKIGNVSRNAIAEFDLGTGTVTSWNAGLSEEDAVGRIWTTPGKIFLKGGFDTLAGVPKRGIGAISYNGITSSWNVATIDPNTYISDFAIKDTGVYLIGSFSQINGTPRNMFARVNTTTGAVSSWGASLGGNPWTEVYNEINIADSTIYIGGTFNHFLGTSGHPGLGAANIPTATVDSWNPKADKSYGLSVAGNYLYTFGTASLGNVPVSERLAVIDRYTGAILPWYSRINYGAADVVNYGSMIIVGGVFDSSSGEFCRSLAMFDPFEFKLDSVDGNFICPGAVKKAYYHTTNPFVQINTIAVQLSDSTGSFANPQTLGLITDSALAAIGVVPFRFPDILNGSQYRIRLLSVSPFLISDTSVFMPVSHIAKPVFATNDSSQCLIGNSFQFSNPSDNIVSRAWLINNTFLSSDSTVMHTFDSATTYAVKLLATNTIGCNYEITRDIFVRPMPQAAFVTKDTIICEQQTARFNDTSHIATGTYTRFWSIVGDSVFSQDSSAGRIMSAPGIFHVRLLLESQYGCKDSLTKEITVLPKPYAGFSTNSPAQCLNINSFTFADTSTISSGTFTRKWNAPNDTLPVYFKKYVTPGTYTVKLLVTSDMGCRDSVTHAVKVYPVPEAVIISVSGTTDFCDGQNIVLQSSKANTWSYQWLRDTLPVIGADSFVLTTLSDGRFTVEITDTNGCRDTSNSIVLNKKLVPVLSIHAMGDTVFCKGSSVTLIADSIVGGGFQWFKNHLPVSGISSRDITLNTSGIYSARVTASNGCIDTSNAINITVHELPHAAIGAGSDTSFCQGHSVWLYSDSVSGFRYNWFKNGSMIYDSSIASYAVSEAGSYSVAVTDTNGCRDTSRNLTVTVFALPEAAIHASGSTSFCDGNAVVLYSDSAATLSFSWFQNNSPIIAGVNSFLARNSGNYYAVATDHHMCRDTSSEIGITVYDLPEAVLHIEGDTTFCQGLSVTLYSDSIPGYSYQWRVNGTTVNQAEEMVYIAGISGNYDLVVTDSNSCKDTSIKVNVLVHALPPASISAIGNPAFCDGDSVVLNANVGTSLSYQWMLNDTLIAGAVQQEYVAIISGVYTVKITNEKLCDSLAEAVPVEVFELPVKPVVLQSGDTLISSAATGNQWYLNNTPIPGAVSQHYLTTQSGTYYVETTSIHGCTSISDSLHAIKTGLADVYGKDSGIKIFPNPARNTFTIQSSSISQVDIYDARGVKVTSVIVANAVDELTLSQDLKPGLYLVNVYSDQIIRTARLIIQ